MKRIPVALLIYISLVLACSLTPLERHPTQTPFDLLSTLTPTSTLTATPVPTETLKIAYLDVDDNVNFWENGNMQFLTNDAYKLDLSDDGQLIAFGRDGELWVVNKDGSNERRLISQEAISQIEPIDPGVNIIDFGWFPNSHLLIFNTILKENYGYHLANDLHSVNADTLQYSRLLSPGQGGHFTFSPDAQKILVVSPSHMAVVNPDGSNYRSLLSYAVPFPSEAAYYVRPTWSNDSTFVITSLPPEDFFYNTEKWTPVLKIPISGEPPSTLTHFPPNCGDPVIMSPDFEKMLFTCFGYKSHIYEVDTPLIDGQEAKINQIPVDDCRLDGWAPDSQGFICFSEKTGLYMLHWFNATTPISLTEKMYLINKISWLDSTNYLYVDSQDQLRLSAIGKSSIVLIPSVGSYDFAQR